MKSATEQVSYEDLYARWERGNWRASDLDFTEDRKHWHERFSDFERRAAIWNYSMFMFGEDSVTENLSPYIDAAPREEQKYFLATQQVDEARHAVFFKRFLREVADVGDGTVAGGLDAIRPQLTWGFRKTFGRLDQMADELRRDRSKPKFAQAITLYHLIVEASLAQPGQHFIERYLEDRDILPGFAAGMRNIALDEQRHIGFGVKMLSDLIAEDPECVPAIEELLREIIPYVTALFIPPGWDERYVTVFGFTMNELFAAGAVSLEAKLRAAGLDPSAMRIPLPVDLPPEERARRGIALLRAGYMGPPNGGVREDPEALAMLFDGLVRQVNHRHVPRGGATLLWEFADAQPWYVQIDNGSTRAAQGRPAHADLTFHCRLEDWIAIASGRRDPLRQMATLKVRPRGSLRLLARLPKMLA